jgi:hypothetical protein
MNDDLAVLRSVKSWGREAGRHKECLDHMKGMPEILTWRILGTSLERTSRVDLSDPTSLIVKNEEGFRSTTGPEPEPLPTLLIGTSPREDKVAAP